MRKLPKLILTDIDGVWTDGGMYYDEQGNELKKFNTSDSAGVLLCEKLGIPVGIITGENTEIVRKRAEKLEISIVYQGISDKLSALNEIANTYNISFDEIAYIGDDIGDIEVLKNVGWSCSPKNAPSYIKELTHFVTEKEGGQGAFREFVETIIGEDLVKKTLNIKS